MTPMPEARPPLPPFTRDIRDAEDASRGRRLELPRPGTRLARLHAGQPVAQPGRVPLGARSDRRVPSPEVVEGARLTA